MPGFTPGLLVWSQPTAEQSPAAGQESDCRYIVSAPAPDGPVNTVPSLQPAPVPDVAKSCTTSDEPVWPVATQAPVGGHETAVSWP